MVTLGTFDGVHRGHQELIRRTVVAAREATASSARSEAKPSEGFAGGIVPPLTNQVLAVAYTFDPHPAKILAPKVAPRTLTSIAERVRVMRGFGIDHVEVVRFDREFSELTADAWVTDHLVAQFHPLHVVIGFNFSYGRDRGGDPAHLTACGKKLGFTVETVEPVSVSTVVCSSTRVREFLLEGNVEGAQMILGRPFALTGTVIKGEQRGRTIGIPTANLAPESELIPDHGVYATRVYVDDSSEGIRAVTNIGNRPTFQGAAVSIESHLIQWTGDLYDKRLRVELHARVRDERRFNGIEALAAQIRLDIEEAKRLLT